MSKSTLSFFLLLLFAAAASAQDTSINKGLHPVAGLAQNEIKGETYAIIVGVSNYPGIQPLRYADKDAELFRDFLQTPAGGSAKTENILTLLNDKATANAFNVKAYGWLKTMLKSKMKSGDRLYIYFSGHGDAMGEENYFLLPYDCTPNKDDNTYLGTGNIDMHKVKTLFIKPAIDFGMKVLLIVDACRTNELVGGEQGQKNFVAYVQAIAEQKRGEIIMLSTGSGQVSVESPKIGNGHGLFTWYLIDGLSGMADKDGDAADNDGIVSLSEITSWVKNKVKKDAKQIFKTDQLPFFCCSEKEQETIAIVDSNTYNSWVAAKNLNKLTGDENLFAVAGKKPGGNKGAAENNDTALIAIYNQFIQAQKEGKLTGDRSAETFYNKMEKRWPGNSLTEDARYSLASEFLNFGQQKINLFLNGKGINYVQTLEEQFRKTNKDTASANGRNADSVQLQAGVAEQVTKMRTLTITGFDKAATMAEKAIALLQNEPELLESIYAKYYFLKAQAVNEKANNNITEFKDALKYARMAINRDTSAAYNYYLMGSLLSSLDDDSSIYYFEKAISLAPRWAYPVKGLAGFYSSKGSTQEALDNYWRAVELDSLCNAWQNIGLIYHQKGSPDSAKKYYYKALAINPIDPYTNARLGMMYIDSVDKTDDVYRSLASSYLKKAILYDSSYGYAYSKMAELYTHLYDISKKKIYIDSSLLYLNTCIRRNPKYSYAYAAAGDIWLDYKKDTVKARDWYTRAFNIDPLNTQNLKLLAYYYHKVGDQRGLENIFKKAIAARPDDPELYNEIGNHYLSYSYYDEDNYDSIANTYYYKALALDPSLHYVNYNIGRAYKEHNADSTVKYFKRAIFLDSTRYAYLYEDIADIFNERNQPDSAIYYYEVSLRYNLYDRNDCIKKLALVFLKLNRPADAEEAIKKYASPGSYTFFYLMALVRNHTGNYKEAEIYLSQAARLPEKEAKAWVNKKTFPYYFQSRLPDRQGMLTNLYSNKLVQAGVTDSLIQVAIDRKWMTDPSYLFPYSHSLVLCDGEVFTRNNAVSIFRILVPLMAKDSNNTSKWILRSLVDRFDLSFRLYATDSIRHKITMLWPASVTNASGANPKVITEEENKYELLSDLLKMAKKDSTDARIFMAIGDLTMLITRDEIKSTYVNIKAGKPYTGFENDSAITQLFRGAIQNYEKAIQLDKNNETVVYSKMGDFYLLAANPAFAEASYRRAIEADPGFIYPYARSGDHYAEAGNYDSALYYYKKAISIDPLFQPLYLAIGNIYMKKKEAPDAAMYFQKAFDLDPSSTIAKVYLSRVYLTAGKTDSAMLYFEKVIEAFLENRDLFYTESFTAMGELLEKLQYPSTLDTFFKAGLLIPSYGRIEPVKRDLYDIDYYWHYIRYSCKNNDSTQAFKYLNEMINAISRRVGIVDITAIYNNILSDPYIAFIRPLPGFEKLMKQYPLKKKKVEVPNSR